MSVRIPRAAIRSLALYPEPPNTRIRERDASGNIDSSPRPMYTCEPDDPLAMRPCPWSGCRYVLPVGACSLDVAEENEQGLSFAGVAAHMQISRERVFEIQQNAVRKLAAFGFNYRLLKTP